MNPIDCPLCRLDQSTVLFAGPHWLAIDAQDPVYPAFTRIIWHAHVKEMSDLTRLERTDLMGVVFEVEAIMRKHLNPDKINVASLGNQVPHVHWHVIGRWHNDPTFPDAIWSTKAKSADERARSAAHRKSVARRLPEYHDALINHLNGLYS
uniref:HIT family protein n=1 Tax=Orrella sp. TaxID=1921583 RepID=UPI00404821B0